MDHDARRLRYLIDRLNQTDALLGEQAEMLKLRDRQLAAVGELLTNDQKQALEAQGLWVTDIPDEQGAPQ